jgi:hypothetical protein
VWLGGRGACSLATWCPRRARQPQAGGLAVHPEDVEQHVDQRGVSVANGEPSEDETRFGVGELAARRAAYLGS